MEDKLFTQEDVDRIVKERLIREKRKLDRDIEQVRSQVIADSSQPSYKAKYLQSLKRSELLKAGFTFDNMDKYLPLVPEDSEGEIRKKISLLADWVGVSKSAQAKQERKHRKWRPFN